MNKSSHEKLKSNIVSKLPGFLKKGRPHLEDTSLAGYEIGLNIFTKNQSVRPKSEKRFRKRAQIKSNIQKIGDEYTKVSRAIGLRKEKNFDTGTPHGFYDSYTDNENSFVANMNKSLNSLNEPQDNADSFYNMNNSNLKMKYR